MQFSSTTNHYGAGKRKSHGSTESQLFIQNLQLKNQKTPTRTRSLTNFKSEPHKTTRSRILTNSSQHNRTLGRSSRAAPYSTTKLCRQPRLRTYSSASSIKSVERPPTKPVLKEKTPIKAKKSLFHGSEDDPYGVCNDDDSNEIFPKKMRKIDSPDTHRDLKDRKTSKENDRIGRFASESPKLGTDSGYSSNSPKTSEDDIFEPFENVIQRNTLKSPKTYSKKLNLKRSKILYDISPEKVEKSCNSFKIDLSYKADSTSFDNNDSKFSFGFDIDEKENRPVVSSSSTSPTNTPLPSHLIGFPNYGNTCYLNAVMQSLIGLPTFAEEYKNVLNELKNVKSSVSVGLLDIIVNKLSGHYFELKRALRAMKEKLEIIDQSFSGYKMQDANEFLTRILDTIKDEIDNNLCKSSSVCGNDNNNTDPDSPATHMSKTLNETLHLNTSLDEEESLTDTEESPPLPLVNNPIKNNFGFKLMESYSCLNCGETEGKLQEYFGLYVNLPSVEDNLGETLQEAINNYMSADERELKCEHCENNRFAVVTSFTSLPRILVVQLKRYEFNPELFTSLKVSSNVTINKWLDLDPFTTDDVSQPLYWSPKSNVTIIENTPEKIESKGPSRLCTPIKCDDNGNFVNSSEVFNSEVAQDMTCNNNNNNNPQNDFIIEMKDVEISPNILSPIRKDNPETIVLDDKEDKDFQEAMKKSLEDFEGKPSVVTEDNEDEDFQKAIRLSLLESGMSFAKPTEDDTPLENIPKSSDMSMSSKENTYRLVSVISHFGETTTTGHYVSDVYNSEIGKWFHYDDEQVSPISESTVLADGRQKNGYIFFYVHKDLFEASVVKEGEHT